MAKILKKVLVKLGIEGKVSSYTREEHKLTTYQVITIMMDNASSCDTLAIELATLLSGLMSGMKGHICCFVHIINLASRQAMSVFDAMEEEMKHTVQEIRAELDALGENLTDVTIEIDVEEEGTAGSDLAGALKGMTEDEVAQVGVEAAPLRDTVHKVRTVYCEILQLRAMLIMCIFMCVVVAMLGTGSVDVAKLAA